MAEETLWRLEHVVLKPRRLQDVSLTLYRGVTAVIGWSGAGKTSLLNLLAGFEKPDAGRVMPAASLRIGWVPQNGALWPHCSAREHLTIATASRDGADSLLAEFDLTDRADAVPHQLSQGEQSRLAVARALASRPAVLVLDEPLVHVDPARAGKYWRVIREHMAVTGASLIFSTHVPELVLSEAGRAICLREGTVLHEGATAELYAQPRTPELMSFLGPGNWLTPEESHLWLGSDAPAERCWRPEQVQIEQCEHGAAVVATASFGGSVATCELRHLESATSRTFYHRPTAAVLREGMRVSVRAV